LSEAEIAKGVMFQKWADYFNGDDGKRSLKALMNDCSNTQGVVVRYPDLDHFDPDFAAYLFGKPWTMLNAAEKVVSGAIPPDLDLKDVTVQIKELPKDRRVEVRNIRAKHLGKLIVVEGLVKRAAEVRPRMTMGMFVCKRCGRYIEVEQDDTELCAPLECIKDGSMDQFGNSGCGRTASSTAFKMEVAFSVFVNSQKIEIQEAPEDMQPGAQPQSLTCMLDGELGGRVNPGDSIIVNGVLLTKQKGGGKSTTFGIYMAANSVEDKEPSFDELEMSVEDALAIQEMAKRPSIYEDLVASICPAIHGYDVEKEAIVMQLFGGVQKTMPDGTQLRGDVHILLCGDPGTAKSQLLRHVADVTPRGIFASGKGASAAGLTAAAIKDEFGEGRWTLEAGALVLADSGVCCIDEMDKMSEQDRSSMHEAMEQQRVSISKAGMNVSLRSRCAVLAAANPKLGRFDPTMLSVGAQINLPPTLLSRFDLIFPIRDVPEPVRDAAISSHILSVHASGENIRRAQSRGVGERAAMQDAIQPKVSVALLRKYIHKARTVFPVLTKEAKTILQDYYMSVRKGGAKSTVPITARQMEALIRLSEASARVRLCEDVMPQDAERAVMIYRDYMNRVIGNDIDIVLTDVPSSQRDEVRALLEIVRSLGAADKDGKGAEREDIIAAAEKEMRVGRGKCDTMLSYMEFKERMIYQPRNGRYAIV